MATLATRGRGKIRPPRRGLGGNSFDFEANWTILERAFGEIHTKNASALSFEELYRNAYNIVLKQKGSELYHRVTEYEKTWLDQNVRRLIVQQLTPALLVAGAPSALATSAEKRVAGEGFLRALKLAWEDHQLCMGMLTDVLMYMDRVYCTDYRQPSIYAKSMGVFRDQILRTPTRIDMPDVLTILTQIILDQIQMDRDGEKIDPHLIKSNIYMLEGLYETEQEAEDEKLYLTSFEDKFLESSKHFYHDEGARMLKEYDAGAYSRHAKRRIEEENDRCRSTLSESTTIKIQTIVEDALIRHQIKSLIEMDSGVQYMVDNDHIQQLNDIYELEGRIDERKPELTRAIQKIITEMGTNINNAAITAAQAPQPTEEPEERSEDKSKSVKAPGQQTTAALKWVEDILLLKDKFDTIWTDAFQSDKILQVALSRSLGEVVNAFARCSEYISLFIDENMKKGIRNKSEAEIDATLNKAVALLQFLQDRDLFETYYKKHLCKRLLSNKSQSIDVEMQMIGRMKVELGNHFTAKLEIMFRDRTLSQEYTEGYKAYRRNIVTGDDVKQIDLSVYILTSMTWPLEAFRHGLPVDEHGNSVQPSLNIPPALERIRESFKKFYKEKHTGRRLTWQYHMGDVDMKATFPRGGKEGKARTYDVNCSTYSMLILLLFNDLGAGESPTTEEIQAQTGIPMGNLIRNLQSLALSQKTRLLVKEPMSRDVKPTDRFSFNESFKSQFVKFKVNVVAAGNKAENERERKETEQKNDDSRKFSIEAAIVRIMKQRKTLAHTALITETISQLSGRFKPDVNMIKKRIESLIEREYLERADDAAVPSYNYLA